MPYLSSKLDAVIDCYIPSLDELSGVIQKTLSENFQTVQVDVVDGPDMTQPPFNMTFSHFGEGIRIAEVGGPGNLFPEIRKDKEFDLKEVCQTCEAGTGAAFGPGAGPWPVVGKNCEMVADIDCLKDKVLTKIAKIVEGEKGYQMDIINSSKFSLMANLAITQDSQKATKVVHIRASIRTGEVNFPESIRRAIAENYGQKVVSLGGVFIMHKGSAKLHVMPDFPACPWTEESKIGSEWLRYFNMNSPLVCTTVMHSYDPGHKLRMEHTHCYSEHGDAGHYHYDTTPESVEYEGWFVPATKIYRIDEI